MSVSGIDLTGAKRQFRNLFNSQYPIISVLMNQVSEETLAIAVSKAGGFPSISSYCYESVTELINALEKFVSETGRSDLILGVDEKLLLSNELVSKIQELNITHIFRYFNEDPAISNETRKNWRKITEKKLKELQCFKVFIKQDFVKINDTEIIYFIKGNDGAGRPGLATTKELFDYHRKETPNALLVPTGGIGTANQVEYYLNAGAVAVGCGTIFAASEESVLSFETKNALIAATKENLVRIDKNLNQLGLVFGTVETDNLNNTSALKAGIQSTEKGLIFAGHAVDGITSIESVKDIIEKLVNYST